MIFLFSQIELILIKFNYKSEKEDTMLAFEIQKQLIKEETNEMIIQQKIDQVTSNEKLINYHF